MLHHPFLAPQAQRGSVALTSALIDGAALVGFLALIACICMGVR